MLYKWINLNLSYLKCRYYSCYLKNKINYIVFSDHNQDVTKYVKMLIYNNLLSDKRLLGKHQDFMASSNIVVGNDQPYPSSISK
jgi:hypothetical protein